MLGVLGVALVLWLLIAAAGALPLLLLWFADFRYTADSEDTISRAIEVTGNGRLATLGFEPEGASCPLGIHTALFCHRDTHAGIAVYFANDKIIMDIVTMFPNDIKVTTTSSIDAVIAPLAPGSVVQCLPSHDLEERWQKHLEGVQMLCDQLDTVEQPISPLPEKMRHAVRRQSYHSFTHPWLILTIPYRYFVLKWRYRDVTIADQLSRRWIDTNALFIRAHRSPC